MIVGAEKNGVKEGLLGPKPSFSKSYRNRVRKNIGLSLKFWKEDLKDIKKNRKCGKAACLFVLGLGYPVWCLQEIITAVPQTVCKNMKAKKTQEVQK